MNRHSTNPWARLRVLLMVPAVAFAAVVASACKQDASDTENLKAQNYESAELATVPVDTINGVIGSNITPEDLVFMVVEDQPEFPGGTEAMLKFFQDNMAYPESCKEAGIQGRVIATFVVEKDGSVTDIEIAKSVHPDLDAEAIRVIKAMPAWKPGKQRGELVRVKFAVPVNFKL